MSGVSRFFFLLFLQLNVGYLSICTCLRHLHFLSLFLYVFVAFCLFLNNISCSDVYHNVMILITFLVQMYSWVL